MGRIDNKFITSQQFLSSDIVSTRYRFVSSKRKRRIIVYGLVAIMYVKEGM